MDDHVRAMMAEFEAVRASVYGGPPRDVLEMEGSVASSGFPLCYSRVDYVACEESDTEDAVASPD